MNKELKEILNELIEILLSSCTENHSDLVVSHHHDTFDNVDIGRLHELKAKINQVGI